MFVVSRFEVVDDQADDFEKELSVFLESLLPKYAVPGLRELKGSVYEQAEQRARVFNIQQTEEATSYLDVVAQLADDSEGNGELLQQALDGLEEDVRNHPDFESAEDEDEDVED